MMPAAPILQVDHLTKRFPGVIALQDIRFDLRAGEVHALCGENGAGKSTLIKTLSGIHPYGSYEGTITLEGQETCFTGIHDSEHAGFSVIYQELAMVPEMTVAENIFLGAEPTRAGLIDWHTVYAETQALLKKYGLDLDPAATVQDLGVGQQQLVEIVKALAKNAKIVLLDEPTAALTETEVEILLRIVKDLRSHGVTCIYVSHKLDEVFEIADRITVLRDGQSVTTVATGETTQHEVISNMVGREIDDFFPRRPTPPGDILLDVQGLTVLGSSDARPILEDISFSLRAGEVLGFGGLMGAGRTELLMHLFGCLGTRQAGSVLLKGQPLENHSPREAIERGLMLVSEDRKRYGLVLDQHVGFNLSLASLEQFATLGLVNSHKEFLRNQHFFESLGVKAPSQEQTVSHLSGGNQQKVVLGKALMTEPSVVFLDEPTRGIDIGAKVDIYELINALTDAGKAVVLVSSELPELMGMSDRMIILSEGKVGGEFTAGQASQHDLLAAAMGRHEV
jgi:D-xylose transport system ATP-binding protein